jgi:hypothetical protein
VSTGVLGQIELAARGRRLCAALAASVRADSEQKRDRYVLVFTAGISMWNTGAGYVAGLALWYGFDRGWLKP